MSDRQDYSWEVLGGLPANVEIHQFYQVEPSFFREGLVVRFTCDADPSKSWTGNFQFDDGTFSGAFTTVSHSFVFVVAKGNGYVVQMDDPEYKVTIPIGPIISQRSTPSNRIVIFASYTNLVGYGDNGLLWTTERVSRDGITINEVAERRLEGIAWDPVLGGDVPFTVDLETGKHEYSNTDKK